MLKSCRLSKCNKIINNLLSSSKKGKQAAGQPQETMTDENANWNAAQRIMSTPVSINSMGHTNFQPDALGGISKRCTLI